ncbi:MAG: CapA family protein [Halobacteriales archaeon]
MADCTGSLTLAAGGDAIVARRLSVLNGHDRFDEVIDPIRDADVGFANLETLLHEGDVFPAAYTSGYLAASPEITDEFDYLGIDLVSTANNHAADGWHRGMHTTIETLEASSLSFAGLGRTLTEAWQPAYVDTAAGRVALIATCSTVPPGGHAGPESAIVNGRPGIAPLRLTSTYVVPEDHYEQLQTISEELGFEAIKQWRRESGIPDPSENFDFFNADLLSFTNADQFHLQFEPGDEFAVQRHPYQTDVEMLRRQIEYADRQADWVLVSVHSHEAAGAWINQSSIPTFLETVARDCVDAGADAILGHGAHTLRGIELYNGTPIFYGLGNFVAHIESVERLPASMYMALGLDPTTDTAADVYDRLDIHDADEYWESVLPVCQLTNEGLRSITLHPIDLGADRPRSQRGTPLRAETDHGEEILDRLVELSSPYGIDISVEDGYGRIVPDENT